MKKQPFFGTALLAAILYVAPTVVHAASVSGIDFQYDPSGATVTNTTNTVVTMTATSDCVAHTSVGLCWDNSANPRETQTINAGASARFDFHVPSGSWCQVDFQIDFSWDGQKTGDVIRSVAPPCSPPISPPTSPAPIPQSCPNGPGRIVKRNGEDKRICQEIAVEPADVSLSAMDCPVMDGTYNLRVVESDKSGETIKVQYTNLSSGEVVFSWQQGHRGEPASYPDIHLGAGRESMRIESWVVTQGKAKRFELVVWNQTGRICANDTTNWLGGDTANTPNTPATPNTPQVDTPAQVVPRTLPRTAEGGAPNFGWLIFMALIFAAAGALVRRSGG